MRMVVYLLSAATAVSVPGIVANQMGLRIGDLSMFAQEETEELPPEAAPQLVSYETVESEDDPPPEDLPVDEAFLPRPITRGKSYVALPEETLVMMRDKLVARRGDGASKSGGDH